MEGFGLHRPEFRIGLCSMYVIFGHAYAIGQQQFSAKTLYAESFALIYVVALYLALRRYHSAPRFGNLFGLN